MSQKAVSWFINGKNGITSYPISTINLLNTGNLKVSGSPYWQQFSGESVSSFDVMLYSTANTTKTISWNLYDWKSKNTLLKSWSKSVTMSSTTTGIMNIDLSWDIRSSNGKFYLEIVFTTQISPVYSDNLSWAWLDGMYINVTKYANYNLKFNSYSNVRYLSWYYSISWALYWWIYDIFWNKYLTGINSIGTNNNLTGSTIAFWNENTFTWNDKSFIVWLWNSWLGSTGWDHQYILWSWNVFKRNFTNVPNSFNYIFWASNTVSDWIFWYAFGHNNDLTQWAAITFANFMFWWYLKRTAARNGTVQMWYYNKWLSDTLFEFGAGDAEATRQNYLNIWVWGGIGLGTGGATITCDAAHGWSIKYSWDNFYGCKVASWWVLFN
jgi:hypothetical protein